MFDLVIKNGAVFLDGELQKCNIGVKGEIVTTLTSDDIAGERTVDAGGKWVLPGTIDPHVHVRGPGFAERETFLSGTQDAACGGVTTFFEMPISSPPPYSPEIVKNRMDHAAPQVVVDVAFLGAAGIDKIDEIASCADAGIVAFKTFLHEAPPGRDAEFLGLVAPETRDTLRVMTEISKTGLRGLFHCENNELIQANIKALRAEGKTSPIWHERSRPPVAEIETTSKVLHFAEATGAKVEICHISTPRAVDMVIESRAHGVDVLAETCHQYLFLNTDALEKYGAFAKCNPPVRSEEERKKMWDYIKDGTLDFVSSDHAPYTYAEKTKDPENIFVPPSGMPGLSVRLPLMFTAMKEGKLSLSRLVDLLCANPAKCFGLYPKKGRIAVGSDADFVIVDPDRQDKIRHEESFSNCRDCNVMFDGWPVYGKPERTILRGRVIYENGQITAEPGWGKILKIERGTR
ncbi:dihydroorotase family protein [Synergistaceae bacterium OttesenSCG-928-I11]|nr:dihydroorotase family protein [Synergistaceae bacterium OttesenSCG-928-I11]